MIWNETAGIQYSDGKTQAAESGVALEEIAGIGISKSA